MKIALCLEYPLGLQGGVSVLVETLLVEIIQRGHQVVLVSPDDADTLRTSQAGQLIREHVTWNPQRPTLANARSLANQLRNAGVDLAHFHHGGNYGFGNRLPYRSPIPYLNRAKIPSISTVHLVVNRLDGFCDPRKPIWFKMLIFPLAWWGKMQQLRHTRFEIAVSQHDLEKLRKWYRPLQGRFVQIYHSRLRREPPTSTPAAALREPMILNVGHLAWRKGQTVLAEAFARIAAAYPEWTLQFAGHAAEKNTEAQIRQIARKHQLEHRIIILGERKDALDLMRRAAIYVQPSYWEALGLALQEAMYHGCPAIGSQAGGIPELIEEGKTGYLVEPGNVNQLSDALARLMKNPSQREQWGISAANSIREKGMTVETMVDRHFTLYETALRT